MEYVVFDVLNTMVLWNFISEPPFFFFQNGCQGSSHYSDNPFLRQPITPTTQYYDSPFLRIPFFRQPNISTAHFSDMYTDILNIYLKFSEPLSVLLTSILTEVKDGLQTYCETTFSRSGITDMCFLRTPRNFLNLFDSI